MKPCFVSIAAVTALLITACNGSSSSSPFFPSNTSYVRIANGSPDAGDVAVQLNGSTVDGSLAYASITSFQKVGVGSQTLNIYPAGMVSGKPLATTTFSVNAGVDTTVVLSGERHPSYGAKANVALTVFTEQPYNTLPGGAAVNFYNSAPVISDDLHRNTVQFGYSIDSAPGDHSLGTAQPVGGSTDPQGLPSNALNVPITLYAKNYRAYTITPGDAMSGCTGLPCNAQGNLSLFLIDGPGATNKPTSYPSYLPPHSMADFIGTFDGNGLIQ